MRRNIWHSVLHCSTIGEDQLIVMNFEGGLLYLIMPISFTDLNGFVTDRIRERNQLSVQVKRY